MGRAGVVGEVETMVLFSRSRGEGVVGERIDLQTEIDTRVEAMGVEGPPRELVFQILQKIKNEFAVKAFLSKPIIAIPLAIGAIFLGCALVETASVIAVIAGMVLMIGGAFAVPFLMFMALSGDLTCQSNLYNAMAQDAKKSYTEMIANPTQRVQVEVQYEVAGSHRD